MVEPTFWNGERCEARRVRVVVADDPAFPAYWARPFVGQERDAVEVIYKGWTFYIDDEGHEPGELEREAFARLGQETRDTVGYHGWGWAKVTTGLGSPRHGHSSLRIERVVGER